MFTDAFFVAFRIPNLLRRLFAEGSFSQAFVPVLAEYKTRQTIEETRSLIDAISTVLFAVLVITAAIGVAAAPLVGYLFAPGWFHSEPGKFDLTVTMLRITFPYIAFISLVALSAGILNTWNRFAVPGDHPGAAQRCLHRRRGVLCRLFDPPVLVLAWSVFVGGILQLAFQVPFLVRLGVMPRWRLDWRTRACGAC